MKLLRLVLFLICPIGCLLNPLLQIAPASDQLSIHLADLIADVCSKYQLETVLSLSVGANQRVSDFLNSVFMHGGKRSEWKLVVVNDATTEVQLANNWLNMAVVSGIDYAKLNRMANLMDGYRRNKFILVILDASPALKEIEWLCQAMWDLKLSKLLVLFQGERGNVLRYTIDPFPEVQVVNVSSQLPSAVYRDDPRDMKGMKIKTLMYHDGANFIYKGQYDGPVGIFFNSFLEYHNLTTTTENIEEGSGFTNIFQMFRDQQFDVALMMATMSQMSNGMEGMYPMTVQSLCLVHPIQREIPRRRYITMPFDWSIYVLIFVSIFYATIMTFIIFKYLESPEGWLRVWDLCFKLILFAPTPMDRRRSVSVPERMIYVNVLMFAYAFIINNLYTASLSSYLTKIIHGPQVDSGEDFMKTNMQVMTIPSTVNSFLQPYLKYFERADSMVMVSLDEAYRHVREINASYCYFAVPDIWRLYNMQQKLLTVPKLRMSNWCFMEVMLTYPMKQDTFLMEHINGFMLRVQGAGLIPTWYSIAFEHGVELGIYTILSNNKINVIRALDFAFFETAWMCLLYGYFLSTIIFFWEWIATIWLHARHTRVSEEQVLKLF